MKKIQSIEVVGNSLSGFGMLLEKGLTIGSSTAFQCGLVFLQRLRDAPVSRFFRRQCGWENTRVGRIHGRSLGEATAIVSFRLEGFPPERIRARGWRPRCARFRPPPPKPGYGRPG